MFNHPGFKLLIVGDEGTGKTTFVKRLLREDFEEIYEPTTGVKVYPLLFFTNRGMIRFDCSDTPGQGLRDGYYIRGQCAIIMFDVTAGSTYMNVPGWHRDLCRVCENIPIVLCGNKVDVQNRQLEARQFTYGWSNNSPHFEISARSMYNLEEPFLYLARELVGDPNLHFVEPPALAPPEVHMGFQALPNQPMFNHPGFKLLMVGDPGTGKTTFLKRLIPGEFENRYEPTTGVEFYPLDFLTNKGTIRFNCWDTPGQGLRDKYYIRGQCAIIMFDVTAGSTYMNVPGWHRDLCRVCENIPIVLCGNKVDGENRQVEARQFTFGCRNNLQHYEISARNMYNLEEPFLYLARELVGDPNLHFVELPALAPPAVHMDFAPQQQHEAELAEAAIRPLPDGARKPVFRLGDSNGHSRRQVVSACILAILEFYIGDGRCSHFFGFAKLHNCFRLIYQIDLNFGKHVLIVNSIHIFLDNCSTWMLSRVLNRRVGLKMVRSKLIHLICIDPFLCNTILIICTRPDLYCCNASI
ncbi:hypothetical protein EUGRSUZ_C01297 [Eucalyptus grandis]|uniref:Uncharacterized protein n=4 Tax=Eucalyptus grandis TaxID=71139 RepID=A0ACC3LD31_EUCGR|nr:hypothetical protein EUGRSUZ_C01297 [Eucalyptus grandis]